jgi:hypothetical protein
MSFINNFAQATVQNNMVDYKIDFISKYGSTTNNYNRLNQLGKMKNSNMYICIFICAIVLSIITFFLSYTYNHHHLLSNFLFYLGWFFVFIIIVTLGYGGFIYIFLYTPQWNEWYSTLTPLAKQTLMSIDTLESVNSGLNSNIRNYPNNTALIKIDL